MDTYNIKLSEIRQDWYLVDAKDKVLGRLATKLATVIRGKNKPTYTPSLNTGDRVVVINAAKIKVTGDKMNKKIYRHHTGFPGGLKEILMSVQMKKHPESILEEAVRGMVPHTALGRKVMKNLSIFAGDKHTFANRQFKELKI
jgi:large subunit ribosomal protein L13